MKTLFACALLLIGSAPAGAQNAPAAPPAPSLTLARPEAPNAAPVTITLADALQRAKQNEPTFLAAAADAASAREDRVQARAALFPTFNYTIADIGNQRSTKPDGSPGLLTGRFVSMDGTNM